MADEPGTALTGAAFDLANAGYVPMPDPAKKPDKETIGSDNASLREAAERRSGRRGEIIVREYTDARGRPAAANEAVTLERASGDYARAVAAEKAALQSEVSVASADRVDPPETDAPVKEATSFEPRDIGDLPAFDLERFPLDMGQVYPACRK